MNYELRIMNYELRITIVVIEFTNCSSISKVSSPFFRGVGEGQKKVPLDGLPKGLYINRK